METRDWLKIWETRGRSWKTVPASLGRESYVSETDAGDDQKAMLRMPEWKYLYSEVGGIKGLYDARNPDGELCNLACDPACASILSALRETLIQWSKNNDDRQMIPDGKLAVRPGDVLSTEFDHNQLGQIRF